MLIPFSKGREVIGVPLPAHFAETQAENVSTVLLVSPESTGFFALTESKDLHPVNANSMKTTPTLFFISLFPSVKDEVNPIRDRETTKPTVNQVRIFLTNTITRSSESHISPLKRTIFIVRSNQ